MLYDEYTVKKRQQAPSCVMLGVTVDSEYGKILSSQVWFIRRLIFFLHDVTSEPVS
jgi:hypothetical protein